LRCTNRSGPEVLLLPESSALLGATGTAASCCGRGRGGKHAFRGRTYQRTDEELHQHVSDCSGCIRLVLFAVCVYHIF